VTVDRGYTEPAHICHLSTGVGSDSEELSRITQELDLGILIDRDLHFDNHILETITIGPMQSDYWPN